MRVVALHGFTNNTCALAGGGRRAKVQVIHRHQNTPLGWLEAITRIGQGTADDHAHRVGKVTIPQLLGNVQGLGGKKTTGSAVINWWNRGNFIRQFAPSLNTRMDFT